ncbi:hypothetical protein V8C37DRAFT_393897 [Trichoderma ceciliae]
MPRANALVAAGSLDLRKRTAGGCSDGSLMVFVFVASGRKALKAVTVCIYTDVLSKYMYGAHGDGGLAPDARKRRVCAGSWITRRRGFRRDGLTFGFWLLAFGFWLLDFGFWILAFGFWIFPPSFVYCPVVCRHCQLTPYEVLPLRSSIPMSPCLLHDIHRSLHQSRAAFVPDGENLMNLMNLRLTVIWAFLFCYGLAVFSRLLCAAVRICCFYLEEEKLLWDLMERGHIPQTNVHEQRPMHLTQPIDTCVVYKCSYNIPDYFGHQREEKKKKEIRR